MATPKKRKPQRAGRKPIYSKKICEQAGRLALLGYTQREMAEFFGVNECTLSTWKKTHPEFCKTITESVIEANAGVAASLLDRATGNCVTIEEKPMVVNGVVETHTVTKSLPADVAAAKYWLNNRGGGRWSEKNTTELTGENGGPIETKDVSDNDMARRVAFLLAKAVK